MKEYLVKGPRGNLLYAKDVNDIDPDIVIEIPEGADCYMKSNNLSGFVRNNENGTIAFWVDSRWISGVLEEGDICLWRRANLKEYLNPSDWSLHMVDVDNDAADEDWILVPEHADVLVIFDNDIRDYCFYKENYAYGSDEPYDDNWWEAEIDIPTIRNRGGRIVWQRHTQPEELPFIDDEPKTVNATLAERQSQYGSFKEVAGTTQYLLQMLSTDEMSDVQLEAMHMICSKLSRIAHGDINHIDSWHDIAGYATLVVNDLNGADK